MNDLADRNTGVGHPALSAVLLLLVAATVVAIAVGFAVYDGNQVIFVIFSLVFFTIAVIAVCYPRDYAHLFLALMWFVGFWLKFVLHEMFGWSAAEPTGDFAATPENWDHVLIVCSIGGAGFIVGRLATLPLSVRLKSRWREGLNATWYPKWRRILWAGAAAATVLALVMNWRFGILVRGVVAQTPLPWPLGGLFAWTTDIGLALALAILTAWDRQCGFGVIRGFVSLCIEGAVMSLSTSSRGLFAFHTLPFFVSEIPGWRALGMPRATLLGFVTIWLVSAAAIPAMTTFIRLFGWTPVPIGQQQLDRGHALRQDFDGPILVNQGITLVRLLLVERWSGLEGVMSTSAYNEKSYDLLWRAAFQRRSYGTVDVYTRDISKSGFSERHAQQFHYASPAGPIGFLFFSGTLWGVFAGMALIAMLVTAVELVWTWLIRDPLPLAIAGWYLAFVVLQLSGGLQQAITGPVMVTLLFAVARLMSVVSPSHVAATRT